jgi:SHS2 domain-containing protein
MGYEIIPTTADFAVKGWGKTREELFCSIAYGMFAGSLGHEVSAEKAKSQGTAVEISVEGSDNESLLINFLSELIYLYNVEHKFYWAYEVIIKDLTLKGKVWGLPVKKVSAELKAATYARLKVVKSNKGWEATVVFDI